MTHSARPSVRPLEKRCVCMFTELLVHKVKASYVHINNGIRWVKSLTTDHCQKYTLQFVMNIDIRQTVEVMVYA